jgi:hypothetical protein
MESLEVMLSQKKKEEKGKRKNQKCYKTKSNLSFLAFSQISLSKEGI